jgi:hypothetical protein
MKNQKFQVAVLIPTFGSIFTIQYLTSMAIYKPIADGYHIPDEFKHLKTYKPSHKFVIYEFLHSQSAVEFTTKLAQIFNSNFLTFSSREIPRFADDWEFLEQLVKTHDVYYEMSDDHRVWSAGQAQLNQIKSLSEKLKLIDGNRVAAIIEPVFKKVVDIR